jgi:CheY-like chemotaxis protein
MTTRGCVTMKSVLIVEDEPAIRGLLSMMLEGEHYQVATAGDGQEALDQVHHQRPDAVVLDLMLPKLDGWQVIDSLDRGADAGRVPIIAVTAGAKKVTVGQQGVRAFLSKPFDLDTLLVTLDQVLGQETVSTDR